MSVREDGPEDGAEDGRSGVQEGRHVETEVLLTSLALISFNLANLQMVASCDTFYFNQRLLIYVISVTKVNY